MHRQSDEHHPAPDIGSPLSERVWYFVNNPLHNDPWTPEDDAAARHPAASKLCLRCLQPNPPAPQVWFCPNCGAATGDCVNAMPFLYVFSIGELARRGVMGKPEKGFFKKLFFVLFPIVQHVPFAPLILIYPFVVLAYWFWMYRKAIGKPICDEIIPPPNLDLSDEEARKPPQSPRPPPPSSPKQRAAALALSRAFTFCTIAIAGLLIGFAIMTFQERREQNALQQKMPVLRAYLAPLPAKLRNYSDALDAFIFAGGDGWLAAYSKSQETLASARAKIRELEQSNVNLVQSMNAKLNELNRLAVTYDTSSGMDMDTIRTLENLLQAELSRDMSSYADELNGLDAMDALFALLQKNPEKWTREHDGSVSSKDDNLHEKIISLVTEAHWHIWLSGRQQSDPNSNYSNNRNPKPARARH